MERQLLSEIGSDVHSNGVELRFFTRTDVLSGIFKDIGGGRRFRAKKVPKYPRSAKSIRFVCKNSFWATTAFGYIFQKVLRVNYFSEGVIMSMSVLQISTVVCQSSEFKALLNL